MYTTNFINLFVFREKKDRKMIKELVTISALIVASFTDVKTREVPDWLSYALISTGFAINILYSIIFSDINFIISSVAGFLVFLGLGYAMFYAGQWGGGDSKVVMGLGSLVGLNVSNIINFNITNLPFLIIFWINLLVVSVVYAFIWSLLLAIKNKKRFLKLFIHELKRFLWVRISLLTFLFISFITLLLISDPLLKILILVTTTSIVILFYLTLFMKVVEKSCMLKLLSPEKLTEGDWIAKEIRIDGKYVCGPKDLGISKKQIKTLLSLKKKKKISKVLVKEGVPFVPSFLIAYLVSLFLGSWFLVFF